MNKIIPEEGLYGQLMLPQIGYLSAYLDMTNQIHYTSILSQIVVKSAEIMAVVGTVLMVDHFLFGGKFLNYLVYGKEALKI